MKEDKSTNNDIQNITQKTKDWESQTPQGVDSCAPEGRTVLALLEAPFLLQTNKSWMGNGSHRYYDRRNIWSFVTQIFHNG